MSHEFHFCPGDCRQCDGIHIAVPVGSDDLDVVRTAKLFSERANISLHFDYSGSIYPRGSAEQLMAQANNIQTVAREMGLRMHTRLNGAPSDKK